MDRSQAKEQLPKEAREKLEKLYEEINNFSGSNNASNLESEYSALMEKVSDTTNYLSDMHLEQSLVDAVVTFLYADCRKARSGRMVRELGY